MKTAEIITLLALLSIIASFTAYIISIIVNIKKRKQQLDNTESMLKNIKLKDNGTDIDTLVGILKEE